MDNKNKKCCFLNTNYQTPRCNTLNKTYCMIEPHKECAFYQTVEERKLRDRKYGKAEGARYDS